MTLDDIEQMLRVANPVPDPSRFAEAEVSTGVLDRDRAKHAPTDHEIDAKVRRPTGLRRGFFVGLAAAAAVVALVLVPFLIDGDETAQVADDPPAVTEAAPRSAAEAIADSFMQSYAQADSESLEVYLDDDVTLDDIAMFSVTWSMDVRFRDSVGFDMIPGACTEDDLETSGGSLVRCDFDFQNFRSGEMGLGPYGGSSFAIVVDGDRRVSRVSNHYEYMTNRWSQQIWEPFQVWITENHPGDFDVLYETADMQRITDDSIPVWDQRTRQWAAEVAAEATDVGGA